MLFRSVSQSRYQGVHAGVALLEGVTDVVKVKALIKAAAKGLKEVITKSRKKDKDGSMSTEKVAAEIKTIGDMSVKMMQEARKLASECYI